MCGGVIHTKAIHEPAQQLSEKLREAPRSGSYLEAQRGRAGPTERSFLMTDADIWIWDFATVVNGVWLFAYELHSFLSKAATEERSYST